MRPTPAPPLPAVFSTVFLINCPCSSLDSLFICKEIAYSAYLKIHSCKFILSPLQPHVLFPMRSFPLVTQITAFRPSSNGSNYQLINADSHEFQFFSMLALERGLVRALNVKFLLYKIHYVNHLKLFISVSFCTSAALYN